MSGWPPPACPAAAPACDPAPSPGAPGAPSAGRSRALGGRRRLPPALPRATRPRRAGWPPGTSAPRPGWGRPVPSPRAGRGLRRGAGGTGRCGRGAAARSAQRCPGAGARPPAGRLRGWSSPEAPLWLEPASQPRSPPPPPPPRPAAQPGLCPPGVERPVGGRGSRCRQRFPVGSDGFGPWGRDTAASSGPLPPPRRLCPSVHPSVRRSVCRAGRRAGGRPHPSAL